MQSNIETEIILKDSDMISLNNEFKKNIFENIFYKSLESLKLNSKKIKFDNNKWTYNPFLLAEEIYKHKDYSKIILLVNNIGSAFLFTPDNLKEIILPEIRIIKKILYMGS